MTATYEIGDEITYRDFAGTLRRVSVEGREDIKGRPGFDGRLIAEMSPTQIEFVPSFGVVWGYDEQITRCHGQSRLYTLDANGITSHREVNAGD